MTASRPEWLVADGSVSEAAAPGKPAADRNVAENRGSVDQAAAAAFEGEIREFVRRDVVLRRQRSEPEAAAEQAPENVNSLIRRVAGASIEEIDRVIHELQGVRDMLRGEGERVSRELAGYASLNHASMTAMKVIGDSLKQWMDAPINHNRRSAG